MPAKFTPDEEQRIVEYNRLTQIKEILDGSKWTVARATVREGHGEFWFRWNDRLGLFREGAD